MFYIYYRIYVFWLFWGDWDAVKGLNPFCICIFYFIILKSINTINKV